MSQLSALIEAGLDYHRQSLEILKELDSKLQNRYLQLHILQISLKPSHIPSQRSFCFFPCILLSSLLLICLHWKICYESVNNNKCRFLANMHWVYGHIFCSCRISTASSRPKKEFKPKSIVSSLETDENTQHNGLTHTSSIKSTGIKEKTSRFSRFTSHWAVEKLHFLQLWTTLVFIELHSVIQSISGFCCLFHFMDFIVLHVYFTTIMFSYIIHSHSFQISKSTTL